MNNFTKQVQQHYLLMSLLSLGLVILLNFQAQISLAQEKRLKIATEPTFPPFEMVSPEENSLVGFDIDLMTAIGQEIGVKIEFESLPFDGIIPALQAETVDGAISGITITSQRSETVSFSRPYFKSGLAIAVKKENQEIKGFDDLKDKKIAVQIGGTGAMKAREIMGAEIRTFDNMSLALQELMNNNVDAVINDYPVTLYAIKIGNLTKLKVVDELLTEEYYGIAFTKNSPQIKDINNALLTLIENGTYQVIYQKWFGGQAPPLPATAPSLKGAAESIKLTRIVSYLFQGTLVTLKLTLISVCLGMSGGTLIALSRISSYPLLQYLAKFYVDFFRGTPLLVQIFMIYFGLPALFQSVGFDISVNRLGAAITALSLNGAAYLGEIIRGGFESIEQGQWEASKALGLTVRQTIIYVIFPQAFRRILPPLGNEFTTILKDTSLVAIIGFEELFRQGQLMVATNYRAFEIYGAVALIYLFLTLLASKGFTWLENWMNPRKTG